MIRYLLAATAALVLSSPVLASEPIEGRWKTVLGETAEIAPCGTGFCITLLSGKYAGKMIGEVSGTAPGYRGRVTDPTDDKTYDGEAKVTGDSLELKGCVLIVLCKGETWTRL